MVFEMLQIFKNKKSSKQIPKTKININDIFLNNGVVFILMMRTASNIKKEKEMISFEHKYLHIKKTV